LKEPSCLQPSDRLLDLFFGFGDPFWPDLGQGLIHKLGPNFWRQFGFELTVEGFETRWPV
jgi:hypothetical protein